MKRRAPNGFTLLELLLAIVLMSFIVSSIMGGIHLGRRAWEASRASEMLDESESATRALTALLGRAFALSDEQQAPNASGQRAPSLVGAANRVLFIALSEGGAQWGGLIATEIGIDNGPEGANLAVWTKPWQPKDGPPDRGSMRRTVVLRDVASLKLSYFGSLPVTANAASLAAPPAVGAPQSAPPPVWGDSWEDSTNTPLLVSIRIAVNRGGRVIETAATVALRQR